VCITVPPFFLLMSVGCSHNPMLPRVRLVWEEGWVHFISTRSGVNPLVETVWNEHTWWFISYRLRILKRLELTAGGRARATVGTPTIAALRICLSDFIKLVPLLS
jgi:hypothetical protein